MKNMSGPVRSRSALDAVLGGGSEQAEDQHEIFERNGPFRLQLECSSKCSADCSYCYAKITRPIEPLSSREIRSLISKAASLGFKEIDWMGGDPMEHVVIGQSLCSSHDITE